MNKNKEVKIRRTMRVVRSWLPDKATFKYFTLYSDGTSVPATRYEGEQYSKAYGEPVQTIVGEP